MTLMGVNDSGTDILYFLGPLSAIKTSQLGRECKGNTPMPPPPPRKEGMILTGQL